jgi:hypothetical protein
MSREYAEDRIREALKKHKGNATKARQQIMAWCFEDARLLQTLAKPHLTGIVAHAVDHVIYHLSDEPEDAAPDAPQTLNMTPDSFGREILKALSSSNTAIFGQEGAAPPSGRKQASQSHIDALKSMSGKKGKKRDK